MKVQTRQYSISVLFAVTAVVALMFGVSRLAGPRPGDVLGFFLFLAMSFFIIGWVLWLSHREGRRKEAALTGISPEKKFAFPIEGLNVLILSFLSMLLLPALLPGRDGHTGRFLGFNPATTLILAASVATPSILLAGFVAYRNRGLNRLMAIAALGLWIWSLFALVDQVLS